MNKILPSTPHPPDPLPGCNAKRKEKRGGKKPRMPSPPLIHSSHPLWTDRGDAEARGGVRGRRQEQEGGKSHSCSETYCAVAGDKGKTSADGGLASKEMNCYNKRDTSISDERNLRS